MARALRLARRAQGSTSPLPPVGAVLVKDGLVVGEGHTQPPGGPHAEVVALQAAGHDARDAILYATLEPCSHYGRTPPCTEAIIAAGVREVHYATRDQNPQVNGQGLAALTSAGISTSLNQRYQAVANELVEAHVKFIRTGQPFVTAKYAASLDGKIATPSGDSKWITGDRSRAYAHQVRAGVDAILVGINTVLRDDPELTARPRGYPQARQPLRVVVDSHARTPREAKVLTGPGQCLVAVGRDASPTRIRALNDAGATVLPCIGEDPKVDLPTLLQRLAEQDRINLLVEGGGTLLGALFDLNVVDKVLAFFAPVIIGGAEAVPAVGGRGVGEVAEGRRLEQIQLRRLGPDILVKGYVND